MVHNILRGAIYFVVFVAIQVLLLNNIHLFRVATPYLYLYFILVFPVNSSRELLLTFSFLAGLTIDAFSNTPGMHAAACTLIAFAREPLIWLFMGKELPDNLYPSYQTFGYKGFMRYVLLLVLIHHTTLFLIESVALFDPLFLFVRVVSNTLLTTLLICTVEAFNPEKQKSGE